MKRFGFHFYQLAKCQQGMTNVLEAKILRGYTKQTASHPSITFSFPFLLVRLVIGSSVPSGWVVP